MLLGPRGCHFGTYMVCFIMKSFLLLGLFSFVSWAFRLMMEPLGFVFAGILM
jgi:hypothetical protein